MSAERLETQETEELENLTQNPRSKTKRCLMCCGISLLFIFIFLAIFAAVMGGIVSNLSTGRCIYIID